MSLNRRWVNWIRYPDTSSLRGEGAVGNRVRVFWEGDSQYFEGIVEQIEKESAKAEGACDGDALQYVIKYDDGTVETESFEFLEFLVEFGKVTGEDRCQQPDSHRNSSDLPNKGQPSTSSTAAVSRKNDSANPDNVAPSA